MPGHKDRRRLSGPGRDSDDGIELTRARDLLAVAAVAAVVAYLVTRFQYSAIPLLPRFAGVSAAVIGFGEAIAAWGMRQRIRRRAEYLAAVQRGEGFGTPPPMVPAALAMRTLVVAKASALAAAVFAGLWIGFGGYVIPKAAEVTAAGADSTTAVVGAVGAAVMLIGALILERSCRTPDDDAPTGATA